MDKTQVRSVISGLEAGDKISVRLEGELSEYSGEYVFSKSKVGRGKNGSLLAVLKSVDDSENVVKIGTPQSDFIMNFTLPDGSVVGTEFEHEVPCNQSIDVNSAVQLKEFFGGYVDVRADDEDKKKITLGSPMGSLNGTFTLIEVKKLRGRHGQILATLENEAGKQFSISTLTHSGLIQRVTING